MEHHPDEFEIYAPFEARPTRSRTIIAIIAGIALAGVAVVMATGASWGHEWYPPLRCCWSPQAAPQGRLGDCDKIPDEAVRTSNAGFVVSLRPGDHPMVSEPITVIVPYKDAEVSPDGSHHICFNSQMKVRCFFGPSLGS